MIKPPFRLRPSRRRGWEDRPVSTDGDARRPWIRGARGLILTLAWLAAAAGGPRAPAAEPSAPTPDAKATEAAVVAVAPALIERFNREDIRLGVSSGSSGDLAARALFPRARFVPFGSLGEAFVAVKTGKVDVFSYDRALLQYVANGNPDLALLDGAIAHNRLAVGFRPDEGGLVDEVDAAIDRFEADGTIADMKARWLGEVLNPPLPEVPAPAAPRRKFVVGVSSESPPMGYLDANRRPTGFDVELALRLGLALDATIEFRAMEWPALIPSLQAGRIDIMIASLNITEERLRFLRFSKPYAVTDVTLMLRRDAPGAAGLLAEAALAARTAAGADDPILAEGGILRSDDGLVSHRLADFVGKRVAVLTGSVYDQAAADLIGPVTPVYFNSNLESVEALVAGRADFALLDAPLAQKQAASRPTTIRVLRPLLTRDEFGFFFAHGDTELRDQFNGFLKELRASGVHDDMVARWVRASESPPMPDLGPPGSGQPLTFATNGGDDPFSYMKDGRAAGFDVEMAERFARHVNRPLRVLVMEFSALIPAVRAGRADFAGGLATITAERRRQVAFSDPYYTGGTAMIVRAPAGAGKDGGAPARPTWRQRLSDAVHHNLVVEDRWRYIVEGLAATLAISVGALALGTVLGFGLFLCAAGRYAPLRGLAKAYSLLLRGTPIVVLLMIFYYIVFAGWDIDPVLVAIVAFGLNEGAFVGEIIHSAVGTVDRGQIEAARSLGFSGPGAFFAVTLPQAARVAAPVYQSEFIALVKATAIVGYIAIIDLTKAADIIRSRTYDAFFPLLFVAAVYLAVTGIFLGLFGLGTRWVARRRAARAARLREDTADVDGGQDGEGAAC